jgi:ribosomal protein S18 acetylase RimI-like enzyme
MQLLRPDQVAAASETLAEAFWDDPLMHIVAPDEKRRARVGPWFFQKTIQYGMRHGEVWCNDDASAGAVWFPPGKTDLSSIGMMQVGMGALPLRAGVWGAWRFLKAMAATEKLHKAVAGPHWYLLALGTRSSLQGRGLGSALLEIGTSKADAAGVPCYLETGTDENVAFYAKRGFDATGEAEVYGFNVRGMVRRPP